MFAAKDRKKLIIIVFIIIIIIIIVLHTFRKILNFTTALPQSSYLYTIQGLIKIPHC